MMYDYLIVGSGLFGSICAHELNKRGYKVLVLEKREHIGGNCYTESKNDIDVHVYGPHIFHTDNKEVWSWINQFLDFNNFQLNPVANYKGEIYSLPFNMWTFNKMWGVTHPDEVKSIIEKQKFRGEITNLEEQALSLIGQDIYEKLIKGYTSKQWMKDPKELPPEIIKRLPVRFTYDNNYFNDRYQGMPIGGYTQLFERLLVGIDLKTNCDYFKDKDEWDSKTNKVIYTGPIDRYFNYRFGELEYKSVRWENEFFESDNVQGCAVMNYTDIDIPYTRKIEHKWFDYRQQKGSWVSTEYPQEYSREVEPMYPVNDMRNNDLYLKYKELSEQDDKVYFGGRLAEYKYYDMDDVIESALNFTKKTLLL
jgi:UDP-galactopyranose mutase